MCHASEIDIKLSEIYDPSPNTHAHIIYSIGKQVNYVMELILSTPALPTMTSK